MHEKFPLLIAYVSFGIGCVSLLLCLCIIADIIVHKKYKILSKYDLLLQYFCFKFINGVAMLKAIMLIETWGFFTQETILCRFEYFLNDFSDSSANFMLFTIWLILMSERNLIDFKFLSNDSSFDFSSNCSVIQQKILKFFHKRRLYIVIFYLVNLSITLSTAFSSISGWYFDCHDKSHISYYTFSFHVLPFSFWIVSFSLLTWSFFGGKRDPIGSELSLIDKKFIKFFKMTSIAEGFEVFVHYIFALHTFQQDSNEHYNLISKFISIFFFFYITLLYLFHEYKEAFFASTIGKILFSNKNSSNDVTNNEVYVSTTIKINNDLTNNTSDSLDYACLVNDID